jgi:hypothetical protein
VARRDDTTPSGDESGRPVPPTAKQAQKDLTVKQQREARRAEKVAALKKQQDRARRNRLIGIITGSVAVVAVVAIVIGVVVSSGTPKQDPDDISIQGLQTWDSLPSTHVQGTVDYAAKYDGMSPPAGGEHNAMWLNCGVYDQPQPNENAVHDLEHGAVWITYDAAKVTGDDLANLQKYAESFGGYVTMSPYEGLDSAIALSAWGAQVKVDSVDDQRIKDFMAKYWKSPNAPEAGAACTGALEGEGRVG